MIAAAGFVVAGLLWAESAGPREQPMVPGMLLQCADDGYEEDDTMGSARSILFGSAQNHLHCDEDWVWYPATPGATYQIETSNLVGGADTVLELYLSGAGLVASDNDGGAGLASLIIWSNATDYFNWVRITENNGDYQNGEGYTIVVDCIAGCACTDDAYEEDDSMASAVLITIGSTGHQTHLHCDEDWVEFQSVPGATYYIETYNLIGGADTVIELYNSGSLLASDDNGGSGLGSLITWTNPSDYFNWVRIKEYNDDYQDGEGYTILVDCTAGCGCVDDGYEEDDTQGAAGYVLVDGPAQSHLHCDEDWLYYWANPGASYQIETSNLTGGADTVLGLYDSGGTLIISDNDGGSGLASLINWTNSAHPYLAVRITELNGDYQNGEGYDVQVNCTANCGCHDDQWEHDDWIGAAKPITVDGAAQSHRHCDEDWVTFVPSLGATYRIETSNLTGGADTVLGLYDSTLLVSDDNSGAGLASLLVWTADIDYSVTVRVTEYNDDYQPGEGYDIEVDCLADCPCDDDYYEEDDSASAATLLILGSVQAHQHCDEDWAEFAATPGATYRIETSNLGGGADTVLELHGSSGLLTYDDDGGGGLASLITWTGSEPWYWVRVTEHADDYQDGESYYLRASCVADCPCTDDFYEEDDLISAATEIFPNAGSAQVHKHCDEDWVFFQAVTGATYRIETSNLIGGADTVLELHGSGGLVANDDDGGAGLASLISWTASEPLYSVRVTEHADDYQEGEGYDLSVDCVADCPCSDDAFEDDDFASAATEIFPDAGSAQVHSHCDEDWVFFQAATGATYRIETSNLTGGADTVLELYGSGGLATSDNDGGDGLASLITWTASEPLYTVRVTEHADDYQDGEGYSLSVDCVADCPCTDDGYEEDDSAVVASRIEVGGGARTLLHCDEDWLKFAATSGATYRIETSNLVGGADTVLELYTAVGMVAADDNSGAGLASLLLWTATESSWHEIRVREYADDYQEGEGYDIEVTCILDCPSPDIFSDGFESGDVSAWSSAIQG
jgi:mannose-6-phosphate isomerase-like protein (cupin superfamily)